MRDDPERPPDTTPIFTSRRRRQDSSDAMTVLALVVGGLLLAVGLVWWFWVRSADPTPMATPATPDVLPGPTTAPTTGVDVADQGAPLPPLDSSDVAVRTRLDDLSSDPSWTSWLQADDLVVRFVTSVATVASGASPAEHLPFLQPSDTFTVVERDGRVLMDPAGYRRYDAITRVITSVDPQMAAGVYRRLKPLFTAAWQPLGFGGTDFDGGVARALGVMLSVEVEDRPIELQRGDVGWEYADPALEGLAPAAKHLVRAGPANARRVQARVRALADALGIEPIPPA